MAFSDDPGPVVPARIFLSHKSSNKDRVRDYKSTLEVLGLKPWLDEDDLPAGSELHRALQRGMKESCAAVFFITPDFKDEAFLRAEINHAIAEKTRRADTFSIITLVLVDEDGKAGTVPELLETYVWKPVKTDLQGLREIVRALPAPFREIRPVAELTAEPKVRVTASAGRVITTGPEAESEEVILVRIENHGSQMLYLTGGVSFDRDDTDDHSYVTRDANGAWPTKRQLPPGDGFTIPVAVSLLHEAAAHITHFFFQDELARTFRTPDGEARAALEDDRKHGVPPGLDKERRAKFDADIKDVMTNAAEVHFLRRVAIDGSSPGTLSVLNNIHLRTNLVIRDGHAFKPNPIFQRMLEEWALETPDPAP